MNPQVHPPRPPLGLHLCPLRQVRRLTRLLLRLPPRLLPRLLVSAPDYFICSEKSIRLFIRAHYLFCNCLATSPTGTCVDSATYQWKNGLDVTVDCGWLTFNTLKTATRIATWCSKTDVSFACRSTCKTCRTPCVDNATFTFNLTNVGEPRNCSWLTRNVKQVDTRRLNYCGTVGASCPVSCGYCTP